MQLAHSPASRVPPCAQWFPSCGWCHPEFLSLHNAGIDCLLQHKSWAYINLSPTLSGHLLSICKYSLGAFQPINQLLPLLCSLIQLLCSLRASGFVFLLLLADTEFCLCRLQKFSLHRACLHKASSSSVGCSTAY